ncbi:hypothetical protein ABPG77_005582 [Micractinium sp. CCAP 211/92]
MTPEPGHGCLTSPLLDTWAAVARRAVVAGCHLLELDAEHCPLPPALAAPSTQLCLTPGWLLSLAAAVLLGLLAALALLRRMLRWLSLRDGSRAVAVAAEVAAELRKAQPSAYPSTRHAFAPAPPGAAADPLSPLLCGVCHGDITPGSTAAGVLQSCSACGLLAHNSCVRRAGKGCRPLSCAAPSLPHFWLPAGMTLDALDDLPESSSTSTCLYCREPADLGGDSLAPPEPLWRCSLCARVCHVACFCDAHCSSLPTVADKLHGLLAGSSSMGAQRGGQQVVAPRPPAAAGPLPAHAAGAGKQGSGSSSSSSGDDARRPPLQLQTQEAAQGTEEAAQADGSGAWCARTLRRRHGGAADGQLPRPRSGAWLQALAGVVVGGSAAPPSGSDSGYSSDSESDVPYDARMQRQRWQRLRRRRLSSLDVARLDECTLGPLSRSVLPPTAVRAALRSSGNSREALDAAGADAGESGSERKSPRGEQRSPGAAGRAKGVPAANGSTVPGMGSASAGKKGSKKAASWWRRLYGPKRAQWQDYRIEQLPPGCKPVLVFVNTKSGPQAGTRLRRRFLRCLHPLQVVELPRQRPEPALQLFAPVASHVRIVVIGGDGSVAWVLQCLETLKSEQAALGNTQWKPPPVAVLPLGTGNDLARCLGWGGGHGPWQQEGVSTMLAEVQHAAPLHIDRWSVCFAQPPQPPQPPPSTPTRKLASMVRHGLALKSGGGSTGQAAAAPGGGSTAGSAGGGATASKPPVIRQLNNYLGVGVDAKVALEFHAMREQYPSFFTSQLGNKLWYTAVGGKDIVSGHACVNLAQKLQVSCDGRPVVLPPDIEGLMVLNINSYMGGVDLWRNSYTLPGYGDRGGGSGGGAGRRRGQAQSMMDGRVELVAVYGSWHLGQLQVGLARAVRLGQGREVTITTSAHLPMQIDGEPFVQAPAAVSIQRRDQGLVLRRVQSKPLGRMMQALSEVLEESEQRGAITSEQHHALMADLSARLQPLLLHPI